MSRNSERDEVQSYLFKLQTRALRAMSGIRRPWDEFPLRGKRSADDQKNLKLIVDRIFESFAALEGYLPPASEMKSREHAYRSLLRLVQFASFVGSRCIMSPSQETFFESLRNAERGKRSGERRALNVDEAWRESARSKAQKMRGENPCISKEALARELTVFLGGSCPSHETLLRFLRTEERAGGLTRKTTASTENRKKPGSRSSGRQARA
jgi:hypothetical protein